MNMIALLALNFIPLVTVFLLFVILVPGLKFTHALLACFLGLVALAPAALVQHYVLGLPIFLENTVINLLITAVIFKGLLEETFKLLFMALIPAKKQTLPAFFACALLAGLTLGSFESVIYLISRLNANYGAVTAQSLAKLLITRSITSVLIHTFCAGLSGLYLWMFKNKEKGMMPFFWAVLLHGVYNFFAGFKSGFYSFAVIAILFAALECRIWYKTAVSLLPEKENS